MFWLNIIAFFNIAFKVFRRFFDFFCKVWTNFCKIRIEMLGNEVYICNSFRLMYDFFRETWLCTFIFSYGVFNDIPSLFNPLTATVVKWGRQTNSNFPVTSKIMRIWVVYFLIGKANLKEFFVFYPPAGWNK